LIISIKYKEVLLNIKYERGEQGELYIFTISTFYKNIISDMTLSIDLELGWIIV